jgi:hypothetical protein
MIRFDSRLREWKLVILVIAVLSLMVAPHLVGATKKTRAARVVCDFNLIIKASMSAMAETGDFPASGEWGEIPEELAYYLPSTFEFQFGTVTYRWRHWNLPSGLPKDPQQKVLVGLQVRSGDLLLIAAIVELYQGRIAQLQENQVTLVIL